MEMHRKKALYGVKLWLALSELCKYSENRSVEQCYMVYPKYSRFNRPYEKDSQH